LNYNGIGGDGKFIVTPEGTKAIAEALPHCPNLQVLRCASPTLQKRDSGL